MEMIQIMVGNEATTTAHPTQIRLIKDGREAGQPRRSMRVLETGRSMPATAEPERSTVAETDIRQIPDLSDCEQRRNYSDEIVDRMSRKRKYPSESVELTGLPRRSKRSRKAKIENEFEYY
nr:uncharacterized protein LOC115256415 [Aedes albopictus]